ncbi:hypothetical protein [Ornithinimicrobium sp. INDO-MA30-4]|uniref:DinB/UmuC family translesion DNA polymerase n=1 Tax=Ornithinimicrobium sp. INDO-MA30-4 TaxID=2908651 RepID=UPI001F3F709D|nr:hypothetical protein [Ornithinimicrobium sp. INDO-MA30-4]UJH71293.1 hypothetical protein L0A91_05795 [Ornithinimicrobium sp. INDO-MA30-4]
MGADHDAVKPVKSERSTGASQTFDYDIDDPELCRRQLLHLSERTAGRMRRSNMLGRTVVLTVRFADFTTITRSRTLATPTNSTREVHAAAQAALAALGLQRARVRLLGCGSKVYPRDLKHWFNTDWMSRNTAGQMPNGRWTEQLRASERVPFDQQVWSGQTPYRGVTRRLFERNGNPG